MATIEVLDSTLRDGAQAPGISYSLQDKLKIIGLLDRLGVDLIEAGNPASNPKDAELYRRAERLRLKRARLAAFGMTCRTGISPQEDPAMAALLAADTGVVVLVGKASADQVRRVLQTDLAENLRMIEQSCRYLAERGRSVIFDAEHFFDAWSDDPGYAQAALRAALAGGARCLCLCDTRGGALPDEITAAVSRIRQGFPGCPIGIHTHDDGALAVANTLQAVRAGASHVQGTLLGYGERCGNANLASVLSNLMLKMDFQALQGQGLEELTPICRQVADLANKRLPDTQPFVGTAAFSHKAGLHIDGVLKDRESFEHIPPEAVGNRRHFVVSEVAGRSLMARRLGGDYTKDSPEVADMLAQVKEKEGQGYQYENAQGSFELMAARVLGRYQSFFTLKQFSILTQRGKGGEQATHATAMIKIEVDGRSEITAAEGNGPVDALNRALQKALRVFYPAIDSIRLTDYKVRVIDSEAGAAASVRVLIEFTDGREIWNTVGVSTDVIEASWLALVDGAEVALMHRGAERVESV